MTLRVQPAGGPLDSGHIGQHQQRDRKPDDFQPANPRQGPSLCAMPPKNSRTTCERFRLSSSRTAHRPGECGTDQGRGVIVIGHAPITDSVELPKSFVGILTFSRAE